MSLARIPAVSIILPLYNRLGFVDGAFASIRAQTERNWELIVVDDGSTDGTLERVTALKGKTAGEIRIHRQANRGAYGARKTGLADARGRYVAFFDSDDLWRPRYLESCLAVLEAHGDVDWVYGACEIVDLKSGHLLSSSSFRDHGAPRPFMRLGAARRGAARLLPSRSALLCQIRDGLYCGLQNSVMRRTIFERLQFESDSRNEAEDQLFAIRALSAGFRLAYIDEVFVTYRVHDGNSSAASLAAGTVRRRAVFEALVNGYARLSTEVSLTPKERRAVRRRVGLELFWSLGYSTLWTSGDLAGAIDAYERALRFWPWDLRQLKTYALARLKVGRADWSKAEGSL